MADEIQPAPPLADQIAGAGPQLPLGRRGPVQQHAGEVDGQAVIGQAAIAQVVIAPAPGRFRKWLRYRPLWWIALVAFFSRHAEQIFFVLLLLIPNLIFVVSFALLVTSVYAIRFGYELKSTDEERFREVHSLPRGVTYSVVGMVSAL